MYKAIEELHERCLKINLKETTSIGEFTLKLVSLGGAIMERALNDHLNKRARIVGPDGKGIISGSSETGDSSPSDVSEPAGDSGVEGEGTHIINPP